MKFLLVQPKQYAEFNYTVNLGLATIGAIARNDGHDVSAIDFDALKYRGQTEFSVSDADVVLMSGMITNVRNIRTAAEKLRSHLIDATFILGGGCASVASPDVLKYLSRWFDFFVSGEGDEVILPLLRKIESKKGCPSEITNVLCFKDGRISGERKYAPPDITNAVIPAYDLFDMEAYADFNAKTGLAFDIYSSRGCPWDCGFCYRVSGGNLRARSVESVLNDMDHVHDAYGVSRFNFVDDTFGLKKGWIEDFCAGVKERRYAFRFQAMINSLRSRKKMDIMRDSGLFGISMGIESGSVKILDYLGKKNDLDAARNLIKYCHDNDISVSATFIIGVPGETWKTITETRDFIAENKLDSFQLFFLNPYPGTRVFDCAVEEGVIGDSLDYVLNIGLEDEISINMTEHDDSVLHAMKDFILDGVLSEENRGYETASWKRFQAHKPMPVSLRGTSH